MNLQDRVKVSPAPAENKQPRAPQARSERTKIAILEATIDSLDRFGFAETSFKTIQSLAAVSRGTITHHYPTRDAVILAATEHMLSNTLKGIKSYQQRKGTPHDADAASQIVHGSWSKVVNTAHGRAFIEVMVASRTNPSLYNNLSKITGTWDAEVDELIRDSYGHKGDEIAEVWEFVRTYLRGLLIHVHLVKNADEFGCKLDRFAKVVGRQISAIENEDT